MSITFGPDGNLYVGGSYSSNVVRYDGTTGAYIDTFVAAGSGGLFAAQGLAFGPDGNLYVCSNFSHQILRYDGHTGAFLGTFVSAGSGGLNRPTYLLFHDFRAQPHFLPPVSYPVGGGANYSIAVADLNGDGIPDVVVTNAGGADTVTVLLGNGDGTFQAGTSYPAGHQPASVAVGDFNGDGIPDLVVGNGFRYNVSVLLGNGDGSFQAPVSYDASFGLTGYVESVAVGDFTGNGILDLAVESQSSVSVLLGNGDGTFQPPQVYPVSGGVVPNTGLAVGDFTGNGVLDIVTRTGELLLGNGDGTFQPAIGLGFGGSSIVAGDFNGDGNLDLAVTNYGNTVSVLLGNGDGTFQAPLTYTVGSGPASVAVGDFNGDGVPDLAVANQGSANVSVLLGNGDGSFQAALNYAVGTAPWPVGAGDFNGDGFPDLAVGASPSATGGEVDVLLNAANWGGGLAPAPSQPHRPTLDPTVQHPIDLDVLFAHPTELQPQALLPRGPAGAHGPTAIAQPMAQEVFFDPTSRPEPTAPSVAAIIAQPLHDAVFGGWPDPLLDVLTRDVLR
jgi:hypothetical protein